MTEKSEGIETIKDCFNLFINKEIIDIVVKYTNEKGNMFYATKDSKTWKPIDNTDVSAMSGVLRMIGKFRESRESTIDLWKKDQSVSRQIYTAAMSRDRFKQILRFITFVDLTTREERKVNDILAALRTVTNIFRANCRECYNASDKGIIHEQLAKSEDDLLSRFIFHPNLGNMV